MNKEKSSFFSKLTGAIRGRDEVEEYEEATETQAKPMAPTNNEEDGQLAVDVYQTTDEIVIQAMVAGVRPDALEVTITRDMVTVRGTREPAVEDGADYFHQELYWGSFSRTIMLPEEVDVELADAVEKYGLLTLRLPKIDKNRQTKLKVKSS
jgi:HSP20 family protein